MQEIDKALESKAKYLLINKMGKYLKGTITDSMARISGGRMRGKIVFESEEKGTLQIDVNDILELEEIGPSEETDKTSPNGSKE